MFEQSVGHALRKEADVGKTETSGSQTTRGMNVDVARKMSNQHDLRIVVVVDLAKCLALKAADVVEWVVRRYVLS